MRDSPPRSSSASSSPSPASRHVAMKSEGMEGEREEGTCTTSMGTDCNLSDRARGCLRCSQ